MVETAVDMDNTSHLLDCVRDFLMYPLLQVTQQGTVKVVGWKN